MLNGGVDSHQMLVPHSQCSGRDRYAEYAAVRGKVALSKGSLLQISAAGQGQVCDRFGIHQDFPFLQQLYNDGHALFVCDVGVMTKPVNKLNYESETLTDLFAHNAMQEEIQRLDPLNEIRQTGPLGRMTDVLSSTGYNTRAVAVATPTNALEGRINVGAPVYSVGEDGVTPFNPYETLEGVEDIVKRLNGGTEPETNVFGEVWASSLHQAIDQTNELNSILSSLATTATFPSTFMGKKLEVIARLIKAREAMGVERDFFYVEMGGFDNHERIERFLGPLFSELNNALSAFVSEMKSQNLWNNVVIVETSDFGRTLTPNSGDGTDHAWSGNNFVLGGAVRGGRILGEYPPDLTDNSPVNVGRGRLIPKYPYETIFGPVAQWMGVSGASDLSVVLPNRDNFPSSVLYDQGDFF